MQATRQAILDYLRANREGTVRDLTRVFRLTPTGIRQHLALLEADGFVASRDLKGRVGRPALAYRLTDAGEALYPKAYDRLAVALLEAAHDVCDDDDLRTRLITAAASRLEAPISDGSTGSLHDRAVAIAELRRSEGNVVTIEEPSDGGGTEVRLVQHTCPYLDAAEAAPIVCEMDVASIRSATTAGVTLIESRPRGDHRCTFGLTLA